MLSGEKFMDKNNTLSNLEEEKHIHNAHTEEESSPQSNYTNPTEHQHNEEHQHSHHHHHEISENISSQTIAKVIALNFIITLAEIIGGILSGSLSLLSDSFHNLSDTLSIFSSYFALKLSQKPKNSRKTFGYKRAEILVAFFNSAFLIAISVFLLWEAYHRFMNPVKIKTNLMLIIAFIALIANFLSVYLLHAGSKESINIRSSYLHLISDTLSSLGVILGGIAIKLWGVFFIDPLLTLLISLYFLKESWEILKISIDILMQSSPELDFDKIKEDIEQLKGIKNIHHVHSWMSNEKTIYFEAHLEMENMPLSEVDKINQQVEKILKEKYDISHVTLQAETNISDKKSLF
jgi:cobalt-zinc-cadmium efflux system protein